LLITDKEIVRLELDPYRETADTEASNNHWPPKLIPSRFQLFKDKKSSNDMQKLKAVEAKELDANGQGDKGRTKPKEIDPTEATDKKKAEAGNGADNGG